MSHFSKGRLLEFPACPGRGLRDRSLGPAAVNSGRWEGGGLLLEPDGGVFVSHALFIERGVRVLVPAFYAHASTTMT